MAERLQVVPDEVPWPTEARLPGAERPAFSVFGRSPEIARAGSSNLELGQTAALGRGSRGGAVRRREDRVRALRAMIAKDPDGFIEERFDLALAAAFDAALSVGLGPGS